LRPSNGEIRDTVSTTFKAPHHPGYPCLLRAPKTITLGDGELTAFLMVKAAECTQVVDEEQTALMVKSIPLGLEDPV
jgi:hypothetical protein